MEQELSEYIINKAAEQLQVVLKDAWEDIERIKDKEDNEITLQTKVVISGGKMKTALSFSEKYAASCESEIPDPNQLTLVE